MAQSDPGSVRGRRAGWAAALLSIVALLAAVFAQMSANLVQMALPALEGGLAVALLVLPLAAATLYWSVMALRRGAQKRLATTVAILSSAALFQGSVWFAGGLLQRFA